MFSNFYTNIASRATKDLAKGILAIGLSLIALGALILALPEVFAVLVAAILIAAGAGCCIAGVKIFWKSRWLQRNKPPEGDNYRENVQIHIKENHEL